MTSSSSSVDHVINAIVLGGGAIRGIALLGALQYLFDQPPETYPLAIRKYVGTSIGAVIGYLMCIGYTPTELMIFLCQHDVFSALNHFNVVHIVEGHCATTFTIVQDLLEKLTIKKMGHFVTLRQLYEETGYELICATYNYTHDRVEYLSKDTIPEIPCITALRMSVNLPFLFEPFHYNGSVYLDGGILDNFPIAALHATDHAIAFRLLFTRPMEPHDMSFVSHLLEIMTIPSRHLEDFRLSNEKKSTCPHVHIIPIAFTDSNFLRFSLSTAETFDLFSLGYTTVRDWFLVHGVPTSGHILVHRDA